MKKRPISHLLLVCLLLLLLVGVVACTPSSPTPAPPAPATFTPPPPITQAPTVAPTAPPPTEASPTLPPPTPTNVPPTELPPTPAPPTVPPTLPPPTPTPLPPTPVPPPPAAVPPLYDDQGDPVSLLASYVNAINRREYDRAWSYWENPPNASLDEFQAGYADTAFVLLAVHPPTWYDGAAGSAYAQIPTLLLATHTDSSQHNFVGCYVARRSNVEGAAPGWWLYDASVSPTPGNSDDVGLLLNVCDHPAPPPPGPAYDDREGPVQLLASYFNAINLGDYARAWGYWENPPNPSFDDFRDGYADTASVFLVVRPPLGYEGAAGSAFAQVPTLLLVTHTDASQHNFLGCYVGRSPNLGADSGVWSLFDATIQALSGAERGAHLLAGVCDSH